MIYISKIVKRNSITCEIRKLPKNPIMSKNNPKNSKLISKYTKNVINENIMDRNLGNFSFIIILPKYFTETYDRKVSIKTIKKIVNKFKEFKSTNTNNP